MARGSAEGVAGRHHVLTPEALAMVDAIARSGSFASAARELGKVPSALTYNVRQLEEALDVLLFDRSSRQARLTPAGQELLREGRRLLQELEAVANRVQRVASGWEPTLAISVDDVLSTATVFELVEAFCSVSGDVERGRPATRLRIRHDVLAGTWEALVSGQVDLAIGVSGDFPKAGGIEVEPLGELAFVCCMAPHHPLASVAGELAVADTAQRLAPITVNLLPGQDVLTVPTMRAKLEALLRGLGAGFLPEPMARPWIAAGRLVTRPAAGGPRTARLHYAWRAEHGAIGLGRALQWWLGQLASLATRRALLERHEAPSG